MVSCDFHKNILHAYIEQMRSSLQLPVSELLLNNKNEISSLLEKEIASRYYLQPGEVEAGLGDDIYIKKANYNVLFETIIQYFLPRKILPFIKVTISNIKMSFIYNIILITNENLVKLFN